MGTDCLFEVNNVLISMDRVYVFSPPFVSKDRYSRSEALRLIEGLRDKLKSAKHTWGDGTDRNPYYKYWYDTAEREIKKCGESGRIVFYSEHDDPGF